MHRPFYCILFLLFYVLQIDVSAMDGPYNFDRSPPDVMKRKDGKFVFSDDSPNKPQPIAVVDKLELYLTPPHDHVTTRTPSIQERRKTESTPIPKPSATTTTIPPIERKDKNSSQYTRGSYDSTYTEFLSNIGLLFIAVLIVATLFAWFKYCSPLQPRTRRTEEIGLLQKEESMRFIGSGAFGQVYELVGQKPPAVVKLMNASPEVYKIIQNEYQQHRLMKHPNVVRLFQIKRMEKTGEVGIVMEYCPRGDLKQLLLDATIVYSMKTVYCWTIELLNALQYIFETHNIIHRDIKPENIFIANEWSLKIGDFGLAKFIQKTQTGAFAGTTRYMSPLQMNGSPDDNDSSTGKLLYSHRNDLYAIGLVVWEMVERRTVLTDYDRNGVFDEDHFNQDVISTKLQKVAAPDCPSELQKIIESCTHFDLKARPRAVEMFERMTEINRADATIARLSFSPIQQKEQRKKLRPIGFNGTEDRIPVDSHSSKRIDLTNILMGSFK